MMNFIEKHSKILAVSLCLLTSGPIVSTMYAKEVQPGWHGEGADRYYVLKSNRQTATGLTKIDKELYYFNNNGEMQFGWQTVSDETYYFQQDGTAATGSVTIQGSEYNFQKEGVLLHGWSNDGKSYYDEKGNKTSTNWVEENGSKYYFDADGNCVTGWQEIDGQKCEPVEQLTVNLPEECSSRIIDMVTKRKGEMTMMESKNDRMHLEFNIPSRGIIGLNNAVLTASAGEAIMAHRFLEYQPWKGDIERRNNGSIIAMETGTAFAYALNNLQSRGRFFIAPQEEVYAGQVVGEHTKEGDLVVNVTKSKKLTNMRASGSDDKVSLAPPVVFSLEDALEYIKADEYVEITPNYMRMRKVILDETERKRQGR